MKNFFNALADELIGFNIKFMYKLGETTLNVSLNNLVVLLKIMKDVYVFDQLVDITAVDYLTYGLYEWSTVDSTRTGFSRGVVRDDDVIFRYDNRFCVIYHLLSIKYNYRIRISVLLGYSSGDSLFISSVVSLWPSADWFEREVFDMFGIIFVGHPDLRRILTDYGFIGHPFRKDFPQVGYVQVRYDELDNIVVYESVDIECRILNPKVIREDSRYLN